MTSLTRNDVQNVVDQARNRVIDFVASRQDVQVLQDTIKGLTSIVNQQSNLLRQEENQYVQLVRRMSSLESRFMQVEREMQQLNRTLAQVAGQAERFTERVIVTRPGTQTGYVYSAA